MEKDIRWHQRFSNYRKALQKLNTAVDTIKSNSTTQPQNTNINEMLKEGLIQRFEYTHELAWNVMKDYAEYQGNQTISGSRDATREAFKIGLIIDGDTWMDMLKSRNLTTHTYNEETAAQIHEKIMNHYHTLFIDFAVKMESLRSGNQSTIFDKED